MSRWFRFYDDALDDPKVQLLSDKLHRAWVNLLCLASKHDGVLPPMESIAFRLRRSEAETSKLLDTLYSKGLLDEVELDDRPMSYTPHNWSRRQYKSDTSNERVKRYRDKKCNVTNTVTVTAPETEQKQITENQDADASHPAIAADPQARYFHRVTEVLGPTGRSLGAKLLKAKGGVVTQAESALVLASGKADPKQYIGAIIRSGDPPGQSDGRSF